MAWGWDTCKWDAMASGPRVRKGGGGYGERSLCILQAPFAKPTPTPSENNSPMAKSTANEYGVKEKRATKGDKARRNFELNGTYSQKHLRLKEEQALRVGSTGRDQPSTKQDKNKKAAKT